MILVTQGHEKGIGTEVFLKSVLLFPKRLQRKILFIGSKLTLEQNLQFIGISKFHFQFEDIGNSGQTLTSLIRAVEISKNFPKKSLILTMPSSKDQFVWKGQSFLGHTEFLRAYLKEPEIVMAFKGAKFDLCLLTDHLPLAEVSKQLLNLKLLEKKMRLILSHPIYEHKQEVFVSGFNPHAGENGALGKEEVLLTPLFDRIKEEFPHKKIEYFLPGDRTLIAPFKNDQLFIFMSHDQGLAPFKLFNNFLGINISLSSKIWRMSVDHGTAFNLYGKNQANPSGCLFTLKKAFEITRED